MLAAAAVAAIDFSNADADDDRLSTLSMSLLDNAMLLLVRHRLVEEIEECRGAWNACDDDGMERTATDAERMMGRKDFMVYRCGMWEVDGFRSIADYRSRRSVQ